MQTHPTLPSIQASAARVPKADIAPDCRHYRGDKPCKENRLCNGCQAYEPFASRICIIKLGSLGDVVRTLCILPALARQYPGAQITWVSRPSGCRMIQDHPLIDRTLEFSAMTCMTLVHEKFDLVVSLDKEPEPCAMAMSLRATKKLGIGLDDHGKPVPLNDEAHHYFLLGLSDELKFRRNTRSYPQLVHEALGLAWDWSPYQLPVSNTARIALSQKLYAQGLNHHGPVVGVNVGAGKVFANKMWPAEMTAQAIRLFTQQHPQASVLLLGGPDERPIMDSIMASLAATGDSRRVIDAGSDHDEAHFVALVDLCDVLFCGDTMALHVGIARRKYIVAFFGPTCEQEIELFGRGIKLVAKTPCSPCYKRACDQQDICLKQISPQMAVDAISSLLVQAGNGRHSITLPQLPLRKAG